MRSITPEIALRLWRYFGLSERFWLNLQTRHKFGMEKYRLQDRLDKEVQVSGQARKMAIDS